MKSKYIEQVNKARNILFNLSFAVNCLLVFLLVFENRIVVPAWLQVAGRMHPMILHFPIVLIVLYALWVFIITKRVSPQGTVAEAGEWLLVSAAFTSALTALIGLFLSREEGYDADALGWHKWSGVAVSLLMLAGYGLRKSLRRSKVLTAGGALVSFIAIIVTGHQGAGITHGQNFLLAPMQQDKKQQQVLLEDAVVFTNMVKPVLENKCMSCHNSKKAKGDLVMETEALLLKGGKSGKLWDTAAADFGLMMKRIHLPPDTKKHMPPQGKPQLTDEEMAVLSNWVKSGANFTMRVTELGPGTELKKIADRIFTTVETGDYDFAAADESKIRSLNNNYRVVYPLAEGSPALGAAFFGAAEFNAASLDELSVVKQQLVSLNLTKMPLKEEDLATISRFSQLRRLNLSFTGITGKYIRELKKLEELRHLSLSGIKLKGADIKELASLPNLSKLFLWNCGLKEEELKTILPDNGPVSFETGFYGDTLTLKLTPPIVENVEQVLTQPVALKLKHYISGAQIRFTTDGSEPDSLHSLLFKGDYMLIGNTQVKARAFKPGWYSSDITTHIFYAAKYRPASLTHLAPPDEQYKDAGNKTLIDLQRGDNNFRSGRWIAFRKNKMEALLSFSEPSPVSAITVSTLVDIGAYIMPPAAIEIWGGNDPKELKLLGRQVPEQPTMIKPAFQKGLEIKFKTETVRYLKLVALPLSRLPAWHPGKGDKGWIFMDEVIVN